jgi:hypothetical protein
MTKKKPEVDVEQVLQLLSKLYPNQAQALIRENIQNSIDAGARNVWVRVDSAKRTASFADDGRGIPLSCMHEAQYFGIIWSTKKGTPLIGGKGIGRLTNIAAAQSVTVSDHDGTSEASFRWYPDGTHEPAGSGGERDRHGVSIMLENLPPTVSKDLEQKGEELVLSYFSGWLKRGVTIWLNGIKLEPKSYPGKKRTIQLSSGGLLELYWNPTGQSPRDQGIVLMCRDVRVSGPNKLGIESGSWRNLAGVLNLDHIPLTTNRDAFEETPEYRLAVSDAAGRVRTYLAKHEAGTRRQLDRMAEQYTKAALHALKELGIDLSLVGRPSGEAGYDVGSASASGAIGDGKPRNETAFPSTHSRESSKPGASSGFHLIPKNFANEEDLSPFVAEMSLHRGADVLVNIGHVACPENRHARSHYIWTCCFAEIVRWGSLGVDERLDRDRFLAVYQGWLRAWNPNLYRVTPGSE